VKYGYAGKCRRKFGRKFLDERVSSRHKIHNLVNKLRTTGLLIDKKQKHKRRTLTVEKLDDIRARFENTSRKSLKCLAQETGVSKSSARTTTQLRKPSSESWYLVWCKCKKECLYLCFLNETTKYKKYLCLERTAFSTPVPEIVTTSFQTLSADSSENFACASRQAAPWPLWSAEQ
jgi:hypothetical protein